MSDTSSALRLRVVCGLLASAARLVPVPFLDDVLRERALQLLVSRTLRAHGRTYGSARVSALYAGDGCLSGCLVALLLWPIELLLYPIRKIVAWVTAVKRLAGDLSEAVLLGRTLDRCLAAGRLAPGTDARALAAEAARIRAAFANALAGTDVRLLRGVLTTALRSVSGLPRAAFHALRELRGKSEDADPTGGISAADRRTVEEGAARIASALETPEMRAFFAEFDARFDENLRIVEQRAA
ncbi:MAG TPA: hypothetical protein VIL20_22470 [Sandaracinaceae bacterium]